MYVSNTDYDFAFHSVVSIRFSEFYSYTSLSVKVFVSEKLLSIAITYDADIELSELSRMLRLLCSELANKYQVEPAIIIDDYDLPLIVSNKDNVDSCNLMKGFYSSLKGLISFVHLVYLTGVYPPNMLGIITEHSNVFDVSADKKNSGFVGFTEKEHGYILRDDNVSHLNLCHCPDPLISLFERDLSIIENLDKIELSNSEHKILKKYRSYHL